MSIKKQLQANLSQMPHAGLTLLLLGLAALLVVVALLPEHWVLKVIVAVWVLFP